MLELALLHGMLNDSQFIPKLVKMHKEGKFPVEKLVTIYPASEFEKALKEMHEGKCIKAVIAWDYL